VSTNQLLLGIGLVLVLAVGSQLLARTLRLPAIVVLLPVGFVAGTLTKDVQPSNLLGPLFQPFVSVAVGVILFEAGLRLSFLDVTPRIRPVVVRLVLIGLPLTCAFVGWMAPRGIVAGATASAFGLELAAAHVQGANKILPIVFLVIFGTVVVYGLSGRPVAQQLGLAGQKGTLVLIVGGHEPARAIGAALKNAGVGVRLWAGPSAQPAARAVGLDADRGRILVDSLNREAELEEVTDALLLSRGDDFNALAASELRADLGHGHVYRIAPDPREPDLQPPLAGGDILGPEALTLDELTRRLHNGARFVEIPVRTHNGVQLVPEPELLFIVRANGALRAATAGRAAEARAGDTMVGLVEDS
jgi:hypothetical protein